MNDLTVALINRLIDDGTTLQAAVDAFEKEFLLATMYLYNGNQCQAAAQLGVHRNTLMRRLRCLGITSADIRKMRYQVSARSKYKLS